MQKQYAYFSAAIREGSKLRPQAFGGGFPQQKSLNTACAIASGIEAIFGSAALDEFSVGRRVYGLFAYMSLPAKCPIDCCEQQGDLYRVTLALNDKHKWTREQIADWLYAEEEKLGFVTVVDTNEPVACDSRDSVVTKEQASVLTLK